MTVRQLLANADSYELSAWHSFMTFEMERAEETHRRAQDDKKFQQG